MNLSSFLTILWRRKWVILLTTLVTVAVVAARTATMSPLYSASTVLRVSTSAIGSIDYLQYDLTYTDRLMNTYTHLATSSPVIEEVMQRLNLEAPPSIDVASIEDTELLVVTVVHEDPVRAQEVAAAMAEILMEHIAENQSGRDDSASAILREQLDQVQAELDAAREEYAQLAALYADTDARVIAANRTMLLKEQIYATVLNQYESARMGEFARANTLSIVEPASVPSTPFSPNVPLNIGLGALIGLAVGLALAIVFENSDSTLYTSREIEEAVELDAIGMIPHMRGEKVLTFANGSSPTAEAYRSLRTALFGLHDDLGIRSIVFTSALPNEGKSTIVANLANAIAQSGRTVVVVDCNLRQPSMDDLFRVSSDAGLINMLRKEVEPWEAMVHTDHPNLTLITAGHPLPSNPSEALSSLPFSDVLNALLKRADIVLIDAPALGAVSDAAVIAPLVDATVMVVSRGHVKEEDIKVAYRRLMKAKAKHIRMVINRAERAPVYSQ